MMKAGFCKLSFVAFLMLSVSQSAFAEARYDISELGLEGFGFGLYPVAFNDNGQVAGGEYWEGGTGPYAFLLGNGQITNLGGLPYPPDYPGYWASAAADINNSGTVVGKSYGVRWDWRGEPAYAVAWQNGAIDSLHPETSRFDSATAINTSGQIVGSAYFGYENEHAAIFSGGGSAADLHPSSLGAYYSSRALDINDSGTVVGYADDVNGSHAIVWQNGIATDLGVSNSYAIEVNNANQVLGYTINYPEGSRNPFLWENGTMTDLGTLPGFASTVPADINNAGQIVGYAGSDSYGTESRPFIWENGTMQDLNDLIAPQDAGWALFTAIDINNNGQILGYGSPTGGTLPFKYVLLTPVVVPEPVSSLLFLAGAGLLGIARLRKKGAAR